MGDRERRAKIVAPRGARWHEAVYANTGHGTILQVVSVAMGERRWIWERF